MCQIACNKEMPSSHFFITLAALGWLTIKEIVRFQERMHFEKFQVRQVQNGRLSAIIHLDRPDIR